MPLEDPKQLQRRLRVITSALGAVFLVIGLGQVLGLMAPIELLHRLRVPGWSMRVFGVLEIAFASLILVRATRPWGAAGLGLLMIPAVYAHVLSGVMMPMLFFNALVITACVWVLIKDRPAFLRMA